MPRKRAYRALSKIDRERLAEFQSGIRRRYSDEQIIEQLAGCAKRLGRSPTIEELAAAIRGEGRDSHPRQHLAQAEPERGSQIAYRQCRLEVLRPAAAGHRVAQGRRARDDPPVPGAERVGGRGAYRGGRQAG